MKRKKVKRLLFAGMFMWSVVLGCSVSDAAAGNGLEVALDKKAAEESFHLVKKVRITWQPIPNAVYYELLVLDGSDPVNSRVMLRQDSIVTNGAEIHMRFNPQRDDLYYRVRALGIHKQPLSEYTHPMPLKEQVLNPQDMQTTTTYNELKYMKAYPVYSWIPTGDAEAYILQVYQDIDFKRDTVDKLLRSVRIDGAAEFDYYDTVSYVKPGLYWWRVRGIKKDGRAATDWSPRDYFIVRRGAKVAALGDSITHGGGAISAPPSNLSYDWEGYTGKDIKNLGFSGNTVEAMVERFEADVLSDKPQILIIMGGINNIRCGDKAETVINGLNSLKLKCLSNGIKPVFITVAPIHPAKMKLVSGLDTAANWKKEQQKINQWIKTQPYHLDITALLSDRRGWLKDELATDGLHPDIEGKKLIGMAIGSYLEETFDL